MPIPTAESAAIDAAALARCAGLNPGPERLAAAQALLDEWMPAANALSRKMSHGLHQALMPVTVFTHAPEMGEDGA